MTVHFGRAVRRAVVGGVAVGATLVAALAGVSAGPAGSAQASSALVGTFAFTAGTCSGGTVRGSYIRMILPSGGRTGPYLSNSDSTCSDQSYTPIAPGTDGGLRTGSYQDPPTPVFDGGGNAQARRITAPANFYGTNFAVVTTARDRQTGQAVPAPSVTVSGSTLHADLRAWAVTWNNQDFNQGAPKPDGSYPGNTAAATGSYDAASGAFTLDWTSQVVGGPFDKFTGAWHLTGRFVPASGAAAAAPTAAAGTAAAGGVAAGSTGGGTAGTPVVAGLVPGTRGTGAPTSSAGAAGVVAGRAPTGTASAANAAAAGAVPAAATVTTVTTDRWSITWWAVLLAALIGAAALALLVLSARRGRAAVTASPDSPAGAR